jgi:hypothetical protein
LLAAALPVWAAEQVVWSLGKVDRSDHEFGAAPNPGSTNRQIIVRLGGEGQEKRWPRFHPGSGNGAYGEGARAGKDAGAPRDASAPHDKTAHDHLTPNPSPPEAERGTYAGATAWRYALQFDMASENGTGVFYLDLDLLFRQPRVPALDLEVNGHRGRYYFDPDPMFELGAVDDEFNVIRSSQHKRIALLPSLFKAGENEIAFTAVNDPLVIVHNRTVGGTGDSGFFYDALALSYDAQGTIPEKLEASIRPTVFFPKSGKAENELCYLEVRYPATWAGGPAAIHIGKFRIEVDALPHGEFGEGRFSFLVPADLPAGKARIEFDNGGAGVAGAVTCESEFTPTRRWKIFYAPNEHLDVGYTDYRAKVAEVHARCMDQLLKTLVAHPGFRFNLDGSWIPDMWLDSRSAKVTAQLISHARAGQVGMNAFYCSIATEYPSLEENLRNLYVSKEQETRFGIPFDFGLVTDVPSASWSTPSILASAGIHYFANGGNQDRGPMLVNGHWNVRSPFWWEGPDGQRVLAWFSGHYHQFKAVFGLPPAMESGVGGLARFLKAYEQNGYKPDAVLLYGTEVENLPTEYDDAAFVERWNTAYAWPRLITCRFSEFFRYVEKNYADGLPVVRGTGGSYWADNFGILAAATARDRVNQSRAVTAEAFATLAAAMDPKLRFPRELDQGIWKTLLLYAEHNFGIGGLNDRPECDAAVGIVKEKEDQTVRAEWDIDKLLRRGLSQLADQIRTDGQNLLVFNPLSWPRSGLVQFQFDQNVVLTNMATGQLVEGEVLAVKDGVQTFRFWADNVPAMGYRVYRLGHGRPARINSTSPTDETSTLSFENAFYRVTVDPARAALTSIYDKELGRELVDQASSFAANEYLFVEGGGTEAGRGRGNEDSQLLHPFRWLPPPELTIHQAEGGMLAQVERAPWGRTIRMTASALHTPRIETEILLPDSVKQIEIRNLIQVDMLLAKQASYFAFPWALSAGKFRYDIPNGFVDPEKDLLLGGCNDWFSIQHSVNVESAAGAVNLAAVDAPLVCLGDICRGKWLPQFTNTSPTVFSYALNNYWSPKWAGKKNAELQYRYVITSGPRFDPAGTARAGREARFPLEAAMIKSSDKLPGWRGSLPPGDASFVRLLPANLMLCALKPAEDGKGIVARVLETAGQGTEGTLDLPFLRIEAAREANAVEVAGKPLVCDRSGVHFRMEPNQVATIRLATGQPVMVIH